MYFRFLLICFLVVLSSSLMGQVRILSFVVNDASNNLPIAGAHVFIANTTYGAVSDDEGKVSFSISEDINEDLIISHVAYDLLIFETSDFLFWSSGKQIEMIQNGLEIEEVTIIADRGSKWKKNFKRFKRAFLGDGKPAGQCVIRNPEVLTFENDGKELTASARDLIFIENNYLGYSIKYQLSSFVIEKDGSVTYLGRAYYEDMGGSEPEEDFEVNRNISFYNSSKRFYQALISNRLGEEGFKIEEVFYNAGTFRLLKSINRDSIIVESPLDDSYEVNYSEYLQVTDLNALETMIDNVGMRAGGLESTRFGSAVREQKAITRHPKSHIYKLAPSIILNKWGDVLNTTKIREYGFWATQRVAVQLPYDYGNEYASLDESPSENVIIETQPDQLNSTDKLTLLLSLLYEKDPEVRNRIIKMIVENWERGFIGPLVEIIRLSNDQWILAKVKKLLALKYKVSEDVSYYSWLEWMWERELPSEDYYYDFKAELYKFVDPKFETYFKNRSAQSTVRLDEVVWGGVDQDGIPPLRQPEMISVANADYLSDSDVVFGMLINGLPRAYPKRILAWHEFFVDDFANTKIAGVYCTLCGTVIAYDMTDQNGDYHNLGTSGFLFRSNKLMYDKTTQSLWSTVEGKPVIGPLINKGIELKTYPVVTSTWGEWKEAHPETKVLSLNTGHDRDYTEGEAYKNYFNNDNLMFPVPKQDPRLKNKDQVFVIRSNGYKEDPLAISVKYLKKKKWHQDKIGNTAIVVLAAPSGAARAYDSQGISFKSYKKGKLIDSNGAHWTAQEECLSSDDGQKLDRVVGHNIFWFAWYNVYEGTRLVD